MGGVGNGAAEEDWRWDLNPGAAAAMLCLFGTMRLWRLLETMQLGRRRTTDFYFFFCDMVPRLGRGGRKDCAFVGILKDFGVSMKT